MSAVSARPRKVPRIVVLAVACGAAALSLTGCIKVNADLTVDSNAAGSGTLSLELQKQAATLMGISDLDAFKSGLSSGDLSGQGLGAFSTCEASETSDAFVYACSFSGESFTAADGPWQLAKDGNEIIFTMANKGSGADASPAPSGSPAPSASPTSDGSLGSAATDLLGGASIGDMTVNVTFPGPITGMQGANATKTSDTTATIKGSLNDTMEVRITSQATGGSKIAILLVVLLGLLVLALVVVVIVVMVTRRKTAAAEPEGVDAQPAVPLEPATVEAPVAEAAVVEDPAVEAAVVEDPAVEDATAEDPNPQ